jgi:hypothetical protein
MTAYACCYPVTYVKYGLIAEGNRGGSSYEYEQKMVAVKCTEKYDSVVGAEVYF